MENNTKRTFTISGTKGPIQLNRCPFCKGKSDIHKVVGFDRKIKYANVYCTNCGASSGSFTTPEAAAESWNQAENRNSRTGDLILRYRVGNQSIEQVFDTIMDFTDYYPKCVSGLLKPDTVIQECITFGNPLTAIRYKTISELHAHLESILK